MSRLQRLGFELSAGHAFGPRAADRVRGGDAMVKLRSLSPVAAVLSTLALAGCAGNMSLPGLGGSREAEAPPPPPPPAPEIPATIRSCEVVGRWGYAAYHKEPARARTEAAARGQCGHPYVIGQGTSGGVLMYLADQSQFQE